MYKYIAYYIYKYIYIYYFFTFSLAWNSKLGIFHYFFVTNICSSQFQQQVETNFENGIRKYTETLE